MKKLFILSLICLTGCVSQPKSQKHESSVQITAGNSSPTRDDVRATIRSALSDVKGCYESALKKDKSLEGKLVIRFEFEKTGKVTKRETKTTSLNEPEMETCVCQKISELNFPVIPDNKTAVVDYPFIFNTKK
jgi:hypothetical protein